MDINTETIIEDIQADNSNYPTYLFVAAILTLLEFGTLFFLPLPFFLIVHLIISGFIFRYIIYIDRRGKDLRFPLMGLISIFFLGPFGALGSLLAISLNFLYNRHATNFLQWFSFLFPEEEVTASEEIYERIYYGWDDFSEQGGIVPFQDVLKLGTLSQKQIALSKIARKFSPMFAPVLKMALEDESDAIRVQAATVMAKMENFFFEKLLKITNQLKLNPNDPQLILELAKHYDDYAFTGILDEMSEKENQQKAIQTYLRYLELNPNDEETKVALGRIYIRTNSLEEAHQWLEKQISANTSWRILSWYFEILYRLKQYEILRSTISKNIKRLEEDPSVPDHFKRLIALWVNHG